MGFNDGHRNRGVEIAVMRRRMVCFGVFGVWLHLISEMGSEYFQGQPLIVGLIVFFPRGPKHRTRKE